MLLDVFNEDNCITINLKTIKIFGLPTAVYLTELISIFKKAIRKNKLQDGFFKLDRRYMYNLLDLSIEEQLICDANLIKTNVLTRMSDDPNMLKIDLNFYLSIIASEDVKLIDDVRKEMKTSRPKGVKLSQKQIVINELKDSISCSNYELLTALRNWVDSIYAKPNGFLSKTAITIFQNTLNEYTKGDLDLALRIVQIASVQGYKNCEWAITLYEKDQKQQSKVQKERIRITEQAVASKEDLSDKIF